jgi:hypothetical protein
MPADVRALLRAATLWSDRSVPYVTGVPVAQTGGLLAEIDAPGSATITAVGVNASTLVTLGTVPRPTPSAAMGFQAAEGDLVAFVMDDGAGDTAQNTWAMYAWSSATGVLRKVGQNATYPTGQGLPGGYVRPFFAGPYLYWVQASLPPGSKNVGSELVQYDTRSGVRRVVFNGLVTSGTGYHGELLFSATTDTGAGPSGYAANTSIHAVDPVTLRPVPVPVGLDLGSDGPYQMVSNGDLVVWDSNAGGLRAWSAELGRTVTVLPKLSDAPASLLNVASANDLDISGRFLAWDDGGPSFLMDLATDSIVQLSTQHGGVESSDSRISFWQFVKPTPPSGNVDEIAAYSLDAKHLPDLPGCP